MDVEIDQIDRELVRLINDRARLAQASARAVRARDGDGAVIYRPDREAQSLAKVTRINDGPIADHSMRSIITEIMSASRALQAPLSVAFLGPAGTYTEEAAFKYFGHTIAAHPQGSFDTVFREVEAGACTFGVVPVENSTEGVVNHTLDLFLASDLSICGEILLPVNHFLLSNAPSIAEVRTVYSHQQSLAQCRKWLDNNLPGVERIAVSSNAEAARMVADDPVSAAIAGKTAGQTYQVAEMAANIIDEPGNTTRFLVIGQEQFAASGDDKTALMFYWLNDVPGGLSKAIEVFAKADINMTRIQSRPSRLQRWNYVFYVDIAGHRDESHVRDALSEVEKRTDFFKVIGSFPRALA